MAAHGIGGSILLIIFLTDFVNERSKPVPRMISGDTVRQEHQELPPFVRVYLGEIVGGGTTTTTSNVALSPRDKPIKKRDYNNSLEMAADDDWE